MPTKIIFGVNSALKIGNLLEEMKLSKVFVVTDKFLEKTIFISYN